MKSAYFFSEFEEKDLKLITLNEKESHHALNVRRVKTNEDLYITNGKGSVASGKLLDLASPLQIMVDKLERSPQSRPRVSVLQAVLKGERSEIAVELMSEVGVTKIIFWPATRSVAKIQTKIDKVISKWQQIGLAAIKQSRQSWLPEIVYLHDFKEIENLIKKYKHTYILDYDASERLAEQKIDDELLFIVGPEGGLTDEEKSRFIQLGAKSINIGNTVLRGSTAGAVATALATNLK
jgi:16S rRNA (uracil1498-N3)-methyltransferase